MTEAVCCADGGPPSCGIYEYANWATKKPCENWLKQNCLTGDNLFNLNGCQAWISNNSESGGSENLNGVMTEVCLRPENRDVNSPYYDKCRCIVAAHTIANANDKVTLPPGCVAAGCADEAAYKTADLINQLKNCPNIVKCDINLSDARIIADNPKVFRTDIQQDCGNVVGKAPAENPNEGHKWMIFWIIIGIIVLAIIVLIVYLVRRHKKN